MLEALDSIKQVNVGDVVKGKVLQIDDDRQAIVGIEDAGVEGIVPANQLSTKPVDDINDVVKVGDVLDLVVISKIGSDKENGSYLLSHRRLEAMKVWNEIQKKFEAEETITAKVTQAVKGGLVVDAGVRGFVPASMITDHYVEDLKQFVGQELEFKIVEIEPIHVDLSNYDTIILGTPVWWYTMTPPIRTFLKKYDLSGKVIVPFATNGGWLGTTFDDIKKYSPNSQVENPISIKFNENDLVTSDVEISAWINSL